MRALTTFIFRILGVKSPPIAAETAPVPAEKLSTITLPDPVPAGPLKDGLDAYSCGDYATALSLWLPLAEQGQVPAQYNLGVMYHEGQGVPQDYAEAIKWYRLAAEQGDGEAQHNLGVIYENGRGVPQDYTEAIKWYRLAAEQGIARAQNGLGVMYEDGHGIPQDNAEALMWYRLAAEQNDAGAQYNLGNMYYKGQGVLQNYMQAHMWLSLAALRATDGLRLMAIAIKQRDSVAECMTLAQIAAAEKLAREWKPRDEQAE